LGSINSGETITAGGLCAKNLNSIKLTASYSISLGKLTEEVPILSNKKVHFLVFKVPEMGPTLGQFNSLHLPYIPMTHFNIILTPI
jgi:hypothetical protein